MKKKRNLYVIVLLCFITLVGVTIAYLQSTDTFENIFNAGTYSVVTHEEFTSPTNWKPGDTTPKTITTTNEGTIPVMVRVKFDESWKDSNDNDLDLVYNNENVSIINLDNENDWTYKDGYYYYINELSPGETTSSLIGSITFNPNYEGNITCTYNSTTNSNECSSSDEYMGGTYTLGITTETIQSDRYREVWGTSTPVLYDYVGDNPCTYNGELVPGAEYVNGQYTYRYMENWDYNGESFNWVKIDDVGWGVRLTNLESTDPVNTLLCSSINNKPIVSMRGMFYKNKATNIDLSSFDTSNVIDMSHMFDQTMATTLDFSNFDTSNVTDMSWMFYKAQATTLDLSSFDTSKVTTMYGMFSNSVATTLDLSSFDTSNVTSMRNMFAKIKAPTLDISSFDTSNVTSMYGMFIGTHDNPTIVEEIIGIDSLDTSNVTEIQAMFQYCTNLKRLDLSNWDVSNVKNMQGVFLECNSLEYLNILNWNTSNVDSMVAMFQKCTSLTSLDLSSFDTSKVSNMRNMFEDCTLLETIYVSNKWNVSLVTNSTNMFKNCTNLPGFDSSKIDVSMANTNGGYLTLKSV